MIGLWPEVRRLKPHDPMPAYPLSGAEQALIETAISLTARLDVQQTCTAVLDAAERIYQARSSWVLIHDPATDELVAEAFRGPDAAAYAEAHIGLDRATVVGKAFRDREPIFVPDVQLEDRWFDPARVRRSSLRTVFTVPLVFEGTALGVLGIDSPQFSPESPPGPADTARLTAIAAQAAVGIRNARLFEAVDQDRRRLRRLLQERRQLRHEVGYLREEVRHAHASTVAIGETSAFRHVLSQVNLVAPADSTVLLIGETGTGKELIARIIHDESRRCAQPFVAVNCAALPESLVESELFGYEKGAFTGAFARTAGKFELADRGTMLLDEISDLPAPAQAKLLRVLQEREVQRVGGTKSIPVNVRLIAATNQDLEACMRSGIFRPDLFYRLSVFPIHLPPLRERRDDIPPLIMHFLQRFADRQHKPPPALAPGVMEMLVDYDWPGNIRELQNVVERAVILSRDSLITPDVIAIRHTVEHRPVASATEPPPPSQSAKPTIVPFTEAERRAIIRALELTGWRISGRGGAADILGLKPTTLHAKMKKLGIQRPSAASAGTQPQAS
jgi:transcriptional regulator with GAF, ATPase, and Fis domain